MENILEITSLRKVYDGFTLNDVSFRMPYGFIMGLIGPNGAGKTTIIKLVMNLTRKTGGEIKIFGKDHIGSEVEIKDRIGFVYDNPPFYDHLSLERMKSLIAPFYTNWDEVLFRRYTSQFELNLKQKIETLSRGMRMKYALAIALSHHADLIIMDEPTSGLDPVFRRELLEILSGLMQDEKKSILFSTHITSDLERIADYITYVNKGEIVFCSSKDEIMESWCVVKGGNEWLNEQNKSFLRGIRQGEFGFEALTADVKSLGRQLSLRKLHWRILCFIRPKEETMVSKQTIRAVRNLVWKDFCASISNMDTISIAVLFVVVIINSSYLSWVALSLGLIFSSVMADEKYNIVHLFCSLPVKRSAIVTSRYISSFCILIEVVLLSLIIILGKEFLGFRLFADYQLPDIKGYMMDNYYSVIFFLGVFLSFGFPFHFKFSGRSKRPPISVIYLILCFAFSGLWFYLYSFKAHRKYYEFPNIFLTAAGMVLFALLSMWVSIWLYKRRDFAV
jgi:ABC-2 type transport system ATP-binding protein